MGITIHYKGRLKQAEDLPRFMEEVEDIANILDWEYQVFNIAYPEHQFVSPVNDEEYGLIITPENCEPIILVFDSEGRIFSPIIKKLFDEDEKGDYKVITIQIDLNEDEITPIISENGKDINAMEMIYSISVKSEHDSAETNLKLVELLRYLGSKYFVDFEMMNENDYVNNQNIDNIKDKIEDINRLVKMFQDAVEGKDISSPEDFLKFVKQFKLQIKKDKE